MKYKTPVAMTAQQYAREVERRGGAAAVAAHVNILASSVRKRMAGVCPVDAEAKIALLSLPTVRRKRLKSAGRGRPRSRASQGAFSLPDRDKGAETPPDAPTPVEEGEV